MPTDHAPSVSSVRGIIVLEQEFDEVVEFPTQSEFDAFCSGFMQGAGAYGGDGAMILTREHLPDYEHDLEQYKDDPNGWLYKNARKMIDLINQHLPA